MESEELRPPGRGRPGEDGDRDWSVAALSHGTPGAIGNWMRQGRILSYRLCRELLLLSHFSRVRLCVTPWTAAHQAPLSLGFSRQEHWSGLPFPSPVHESEKWKWSRSVVSNSLRPHGLQPTRLLRPWHLPGKSTGVGQGCANILILDF